MPEKEKIQDLQVRLEQIYAEIEKVSKESAMLDVYLSEYSLAKTTLENLKKLNEGDEVLLPIGGGVYIKAVLAKQDKAILNIGGGAYLEEPLEKALERVIKALDNISKRLQELRNYSLKLSKEASKIREELEELLRGSKNV